MLERYKIFKEDIQMANEKQKCKRQNKIELTCIKYSRIDLYEIKMTGY